MKVEEYMKVAGKQIREVVQGMKFIEMGILIMKSSQEGKLMEKENIFGQMEKYMKVIG